MPRTKYIEITIIDAIALGLIGLLAAMLSQLYEKIARDPD